MSKQHKNIRLVPPIPCKESTLDRHRRLIEEHYAANTADHSGSFGEILAYEIHIEDLTFRDLAEKWGISLPRLGELIFDHCKRLEDDPFEEADTTSSISWRRSQPLVLPRIGSRASHRRYPASYSLSRCYCPKYSRCTCGKRPG